MNELKHVALIPDGNRRFAKKRGLKFWEGHEKGAIKIAQFIKWCKELGIKENTFYAFSTKNFGRPKNEVNHLMDIFRKEFAKLEKDKTKYEARIVFIGRLNMFDKDLQQKMKHIMKQTKKYKNFRVNFAMGYGGREELLDTVNKIAKKIKYNKLTGLITKQIFENNLYMASEPDIIIRPGGEHRLSDFLPWQAHKAELFFTKKKWPEFTKKDLIQIIEEYQQRRISRGK